MTDIKLERLAYKPREVAALVGCGKSLVYELIHQRRIRAIRLGKRIIVPRESVEALLHGDNPENKCPDATRAERR